MGSGGYPLTQGSQRSMHAAALAPQFGVGIKQNGYGLSQVRSQVGRSPIPPAPSAPCLSLEPVQHARCLPRARAGGGASVLLFLSGPAPEGGADHAAGGPASPPPPRPARPPLCIQHPGFPAGSAPWPPLRSHFGLGSAPLPHPPVHGPSGLGPCARGPDPAPLRHARVGRALARAPPPPPGPRVAP